MVKRGGFPRLRKAGSIILLILAVLLAPLACIEAEFSPAPDLTPETPLPPFEVPVIGAISATIIVDANMLTGDVEIQASLSGFGDGALAGPGIIIYYLDVEPPIAPGQPAATEEGTYQATLSPSVIWEDVSPGEHTFAVQFVREDLTPFDPPVTADITLRVPAAGSDEPAIQVFSVEVQYTRPFFLPDTPHPVPDPGAEPAGNIQVLADVFNIVLSEQNIGGQPRAGEGHLVHYFDVEPPAAAGEAAVTDSDTHIVTADPIVTWTEIVPGEFRVSVQIVNNDHSPLNPPVIAAARIPVTRLPELSDGTDLAALR